jgi:hypothetical protein
MLFDEESNLSDGLTDFSRFRTAALFDPLRESPGRSRVRVTLIPRDYTELYSKLTRCRD